MSNPYYNVSGAPSTNSQGSSSTMRSEFSLVAAAFALLPSFAGNALYAVRVNAGASALEAVAVTGTGSAVFNTSPTLVTPALGTPASGTLTNCTGLPIASGVSGLAANVATFLATPSSANLGSAVTDGRTGTGALVCATSPSLVTPTLGTPASGTLTNCTGLPIASGVSGLAAGIATFLATPTSANLAAAVTNGTGTGSLVFATSPTLVTPALGTPTSGALTNCTGLPISSGVSGLAAGIATFLATPSSANLGSAVTDGRTGTGALVCAASPTLTGTVTLPATVNFGASSVIGVPTSATFQDTTTNNPTTLNVVPNGTSHLASATFAGGNDINNAYYLQVGSDSTQTFINSAKNGAGAQKALNFLIGATLAWGIDANGNLSNASSGTSGNSLTVLGTVTGKSTVSAPPAGGVNVFFCGGANGMTIAYGSGAPTLTANKGSLYLRSDGSGTTNRMYLNTDGSTTWTAVTTVA